MKTSLTFLGLMFASTILFSQQISRSTLSTAGDITKSENGVSLTWTVGEIFSETIQSKYHVTGGFQQGHLAKTISENEITEIEETISSLEVKGTHSTSQDVVITLFPNPTTNQIWIKSNQENTQNYTASIFDLSGKKIFQQNISLENANQIEIQQIENLNSGNYVLQLVDDTKNITTKKFTKI